MVQSTISSTQSGGNVRFSLSGDWRLTMDGYGPAPQINTLFGPTDRCARFAASSGRCVGFGLTPIGWHQVIGETADLMRNHMRPLQGELGLSASEIRAALIADRTNEAGVARFDKILTELILARIPAPTQILAIDHALRDRPISVVQFASAVNMSPRTLQRLCLKVYGFAPKRLLRRQRFMDTLGQIRTAVGAPLHEVLDVQYFDQAHFYRDFCTFMGMSPRAYFSASRTVMARAARAQEAAGVTLSFKLPPTTTRLPNHPGRLASFEPLAVAKSP